MGGRRRSTRRRATRPRNRRVPASGHGPRGGTIIRLNRYVLGQKFLTRLTYVTDQIPVTSVTPNITGIYQFVCNGMFDPDLTGGGHQPFYYDQLSEFYKRYRVISSTISVHGASGTPHILGVEVRDNSGTTLLTSNWLEKPSVLVRRSVSDGVSTKSFVRHSWKAKDWKRGAWADDNMSGSLGSGSNPPTQYFYSVSIAAKQATTAVVYIQARINYWVLCYDNSDPNQS